MVWDIAWGIVLGVFLLRAIDIVLGLLLTGAGKVFGSQIGRAITAIIIGAVGLFIIHTM